MSYASNQTFTSSASPTQKEGHFHLIQTWVLCQWSVPFRQMSHLGVNYFDKPTNNQKDTFSKESQVYVLTNIAIGCGWRKCKDRTRQERATSQIPSNLKSLKFLEKCKSNSDTGVYFSRLAEEVNKSFEVWHECSWTTFGSNPDGKVSVQGWEETTLLSGQRVGTKSFCQ